MQVSEINFGLARVDDELGVIAREALPSAETREVMQEVAPNFLQSLCNVFHYIFSCIFFCTSRTLSIESAINSGDLDDSVSSGSWVGGLDPSSQSFTNAKTSYIGENGEGVDKEI